MQARIRWLDGAMSVAESGSGHAVVLDGPPDGGGRNLGVRPMEMVLMGMGGCTAYDVVLILKRGRHTVTGCEVELEAERAEQVPKVFTRIHVHYKVTGVNLPDAAVGRAVTLSAEKYCSATIMLAKAVAITHDYEVLEAGSPSS